MAGYIVKPWCMAAIESKFVNPNEEYNRPCKNLAQPGSKFCAKHDKPGAIVSKYKLGFPESLRRGYR